MKQVVIKLSLEEIVAEKLSWPKQTKVFAKAIFLIPIAMITHVGVMFFGIFTIPNSVVDLITMSEKTNQILRRKANGNEI